MSRYASADIVRDHLAADLGACVGAHVAVRIDAPDSGHGLQRLPGLLVRQLGGSQLAQLGVIVSAYIVVGRPIRDAADPRLAAESIQESIAGVFGR